MVEKLWMPSEVDLEPLGTFQNPLKPPRPFVDFVASFICMYIGVCVMRQSFNYADV